MATEKLGLTEIVLSQSAKEVSHNEALRQIEGRTIGALSRTTSSAPSTPDDGDVYIVPASGVTGEWLGHEKKIAHRYGGVWNYWFPSCPCRLWISDEQILVIFDGTDWVTLIGPSLIPPFVDTTAIVKGSADATKLARLEVDGLTTATTRVLTVQNKNYTLAGTDDVATSTAAAAAALAAHVASADEHTGYQKESEKAAANGYASLDSGTLVPAAQLPVLVGDTGSGGTKGAAPAPAAGDAAALKFLKADGTWSAVSGASGGTVTSVGLSMPAEFSVSGSPVTASGTLTATKATQSANQVFAGPTSGGAAAPAFRALAAADIPYRNAVLETVAFGFTTDVAVGDGAGYAVVPSPLNGLNLVRVHARVITAGTTGTTDIQIHNVTDAVDMLSTKLTIDSTETGSDTAATAAVINTSTDDVATNDLLRIDIDAVSGTAPKGLLVTMEFA